MRIAHLAAAAAALTATCALALSSTAAAQNSRQPAPAPLDFDPARPERVEGWWSNGTELLKLERSGAYQFWPSPNRFAAPSEVGAWRRSNYVLFDLEPYRAKPGTRIAVELVKVDGVTAVKREGMAPLKKTASPPHVFGDDVLGVWLNDREQLLVTENGRYEFRLTTVKTGITQHHGMWRTEGETLILAPDTDAVAAVKLDAVKAADGTITLRGTNGVLKQLQPEPAVPTPAEPAKPAQPAESAKPAPPSKKDPAPPAKDVPVSKEQLPESRPLLSLCVNDAFPSPAELAAAEDVARIAKSARPRPARKCGDGPEQWTGDYYNAWVY